MTSQKRILLAADDALLCETLVDQFTIHMAVDVETVADANGAIEKICNDTTLALALFDDSLLLEGKDAVCKILHERGGYLPVIILTNTQAYDLLFIGAEEIEYLAKPFKFSALLAKARLYLQKHTQHSKKTTIQLGPYKFKPAKKALVTEDNNSIKLTQKETNILMFLYKARGQCVERCTLLNEIWGYNSGIETHTLETHIYRLRQKIEPDRSCATLLLTDGGGYKLSAYAVSDTV